MLISRTPFRISFVGGGTDIDTFYKHQPGAVISIAINKYFYLNMHPNFEKGNILLKYSQTENVNNINDIEHKVIKEVFRKYNVTGVDFASAADIPAGTGMGSSSAFTVSLLQLVHSYQNRYISQLSLAKEACEIEIERLNQPIGKQDQYGAAIGGLKLINFYADGEVDVENIYLRFEQKKILEDNLILFYLGNTRSASAILEKQKEVTVNNRKTLKILSKMADQAKHLKHDLLVDVRCLGDYLKEGWELKKSIMSSITSSVIDQAYETALSNGGKGAKLLGAGQGGFLLVYAEKKDQSNLIKAMNRQWTKFKIDNQGSVIIYDDNQE